MPPPLPKDFWDSFRDNEVLCGWAPRSMDVSHDMDKWKDFALTGKKIVIVGGIQPPPLSRDTLVQIMRQGDKAWVGMSPRKIQMYHAFEYFMGGLKAATLRHFGHVDHAETFCEGAKGRDASGDVYQTSSDDMSKHAEAITSQPAFDNTDVLVVNYDFSFMIADDGTFDEFTRYMISRVDRAITATDALIKAAIPRMGKGGRIIVLTNSLWPLAVTEASYNDGNPVVAKNQALTGLLAQEVMEKHGIELSFLLNRIVLDARPINWKNLRDTINHYALNGYSVDMLRKVGSRVAAIAVVGNNCRNKQEEAMIYDKVLAKLLHTPCPWDGSGSQNEDHSHQSKVIRKCLADRYKAEHANDAPVADSGAFDAGQPDWRVEVMLSYAQGIPRRFSEKGFRLNCGLTEEEYDSTKTWLGKVVREMPLVGMVALVLDSGRHDGVTEEVCLELARLGANIALTYVNEGENRAKASELIEMILLAGGQAIALDGVPYRSETYTDKAGDEDNYIGDLVFRALKAFDSKQLHVIVNNVGYDDGLLISNISERKKLRYNKSLLVNNFHEREMLIHADSVRNLLALHYVVEFCVEFGLLADSARVINLAGIGTSLATAVDGCPFWDRNRISMSYWHEQDKLREEDVTLNTIVPYDAHDVRPYPRCQGKELLKAVDHYFAKYRSPENAREKARVVGWMARPTSKVYAMMVTPN